MSKGVAESYQPRLVTVEGFASVEAIAEVEAELREWAEQDQDNCWGYFPAMSDKGGIGSDLPRSSRFAEQNPYLELDGFHLPLGFNFLRMSLIEQRARSLYHVDSDAATALTGNLADVDTRLVWRLLLNLSPEVPRTLSYLDIDPSSVELSSGEGYIHYPTKPSPPDIRTIEVPPRVGNEVSGVLLCVSRVLHSGRDGSTGHFVASYGTEEAA